MFVEDFIIDAYSIQLREEVGDIALALLFASVSDSGRACVLALLFHIIKKQGGTVGSEWLPAVLQGSFAPLCCCHVLQPWPGRADQAKNSDRNREEPLWGDGHSWPLSPPPSWLPACTAANHLAAPGVRLLWTSICCLLSQGGGRGRGGFGGQCRLDW